MTDNDKVPELTEREFNEFVKEGTVFIDFWAEWCMPCVIMAPVIDEMSDKFKNIKFGKVNISDNKELARKCQVFSIPSFFVFKEGKIVGRFTGVTDREELEEKLKKFNKI